MLQKFQKLIFAVILLTFALAVVPAAHAEVVCLVPLQITDSGDFKGQLQFEGNTIAWYNFATKQIQIYDTIVKSTTSIAATLFDNPHELVLGGNTVAWIDQNRQVQVYFINTENSATLTTGTEPNSEVKITGNWVTWKTQRDEVNKHDLWAYDLTTTETFRVIKNKSFQYFAHNGQVFWSAGSILTSIKTRQYDLATKTTTVLADQPVYYLVAVDEQHTVWHNAATSELSITNRSTGVNTVIYTYPFRTSILDVEIDGDLIAWHETRGLAWESAVYAYQISTAELLPIEPSYDYTRSDLTVDDRFVGYFEGSGPELINKFSVYDVVSGSLTAISTAQHPQSYELQLDNNRIAWMGYEAWDSGSGQPLNTQVFFYDNCGSTPNIITQSESLNVLTDRWVTLSVTARGDEPITYQWYQGVDTSMPIAAATSATFTTPAITTVTTYWVRLSNPYGHTDSAPMILTPGDTAELLKNGGFEEITSDFWQYKPETGIFKAVCNTETKMFAHTGSCALRLVALRGNYPRKVSQPLDAGGILPGDTLTLSLWGRSKNADAPTKAVLMVTYQDGTSGKAVIKVPKGKLPYTEFTDSITVASPVSNVTLILKNGGTSGAAYLDDVSVSQSAAQ